MATPIRALAAIVLHALAAAGARGDIVLDPVRQIATITDGKGTLKLQLNYQGGLVVDGLWVLGRQVVAQNGGAYTGIKVSDRWSTTRDGLAPVRVTVEGATLAVREIQYGPQDFPVAEEWTLTPADGHIDWTITRSCHASGDQQDTCFPAIDFTSNATWTGGILGTGGVVWMKYLDKANATYGVHTGEVTFWNKASRDVLRVSVLGGTPSGPPGELATRFTRQPTDVVSTVFWPGDRPLRPAHGLSRFVEGHQDIWQPTRITASADHPLTTRATVTLAAETYDQVSNIGTLRGVDQAAVAELLNTVVRYGVVDKGLAGSNGWKSNFTVTHEPWLAEFGLIQTDPALIANFALSLDEVRRHAIKPDGRVLSRWHDDAGDAMPGTYDSQTGFYEAQWGYLLDSQPGYVICVAEQFDLTGDLPWLRTHRDSCRAALDYMLRRDSDGDGLLEVIPTSHAQEKASDWIDVVWASHENALVNAEMYEAMMLWASLEDLLGDASQGARYRDAAGRLREAFNKPISAGGFWNPDRKWYIYWREPDNSIHGDNLVTPVNFAAIAYGLCTDPQRCTEILSQIEAATQGEGLFHWPLCVYPFSPNDVHARQKTFPSYENGDIFLGWAELAVRAYARTDPTIAMKYIGKLLERYQRDGLSFQRFLRRSQEGSGDDILANNAMAIVGLYRDMYGVRPRHDRLALDPHLTPALAGTSLRYPLRGRDYTIDLAIGRYTIRAFDNAVTSNSSFAADIDQTRTTVFPSRDAPATLTFEHAGADRLIIDINWDVISPRREWTMRSSGRNAAPVRLSAAGLPSGRKCTLFREGQAIATTQASASGVAQLQIDALTTTPARFVLVVSSGR